MGGCTCGVGHGLLAGTVRCAVKLHVNSFLVILKQIDPCFIIIQSHDADVGAQPNDCFCQYSDRARNRSKYRVSTFPRYLRRGKECRYSPVEQHVGRRRSVAEGGRVRLCRLGTVVNAAHSDGLGTVPIRRCESESSRAHGHVRVRRGHRYL